MKILIAEDESGAALILRRTLEKKGHQVTVAANGEEAWEILQTESFPVVISDWMMPQIDGPTLCRLIRDRPDPLYTYVIMLTSRTDRADRVDGLNSGADDYLAKPLEQGELGARLAIAARILTMQNEMRLLNSRMAEKNQELGQMVSRLEQANVQLADLATSDGLTGLKNHRFFQDSLQTNFSFAQRQGLPLSLIILDVDHFKNYNDSFGHPAGDEVLRQVAAILKREVRGHDIVARYGGEEFVLLLSATSRTEAIAAANRIRWSIEDFAWPLRPITVSVGVSTYDLTSSAPMPAIAAELVDEADTALYRSKHNGRNQVTHAANICGELQAAASPL